LEWFPEDGGTKIAENIVSTPPQNVLDAPLVTDTDCALQGNNIIPTSAADGGPATSAQRETGLLRVWSEV